MASKNKEKLSEADESYKEELDSLVLELLNADLTSTESETILLKLVDHATNDFGNISTIPKALQFLISHRVALDEYYKRYTMTNGEDNYSLVLLLELVSFLEAINMSETPSKDEKKEEKKEESENVEAPSFKLLLYKLEANLIADRLLVSLNGSVLTNGIGRESVLTNGSTREAVEFSDIKKGSYKISEKTKKLLQGRKVSSWGNEYLISLSSQIVAYFSMASTRQAYVSYLLGNRYNFSKVVATDKDGKIKYNRPSVVLDNNVNLIIEETIKLIEDMTTYWVANGFEFDAIDLLLEVDRIESIRDKVSDDYDLVTRVTSYLSSISFYGATYSESARILQVTYELLFKNKRYVEATRVALKLNDYARVIEVLRTCEDKNVLKQLSLFLGTSSLYINTLSSVETAFSVHGGSPTGSTVGGSTVTGNIGSGGMINVGSTSGGGNMGRMSLDSENIADPLSELDETLLYLNTGENKSALFLSMCKELDILEPKHPTDVFKGYPSKSNLSLNQTLSGVSIDSARDNLSYTFVSAFINCGTSTEKLINPSYKPQIHTEGKEESGVKGNGALGAGASSGSSSVSGSGHNGTGSTTGAGMSAVAGLISTPSNTSVISDIFKTKDGEWVFKHQGYGLLCASASLGLVHLWNIDEGLSEIDRYQYSSDQYVRSGAYAAFGLVSCGVMSELDPIQGLLTDKLDSQNHLERLGAILGLTFAYGASNRLDLLELLIPQVVDLSSVECSLFSSLGVSIMFVGTGNQESSEAILQVLMEYLSSFEAFAESSTGTNTTNRNYTSPSDKKGVNFKHVRLYLLSLGLLQLCRGELCEPVLEALKVLGPFEKVATTVVESFAYATSGDVLKIQSLLKNLITSQSTGTDESTSLNEKDGMEMDLDPVALDMPGSSSQHTGTAGSQATSGVGASQSVLGDQAAATIPGAAALGVGPIPDQTTEATPVTQGLQAMGSGQGSLLGQSNVASQLNLGAQSTLGVTGGIPGAGNPNVTNTVQFSQKEKKSEDKDKNMEELFGVSVLCIALLSLGENIGSGMLIRLLEHPLQCGTVQERRSVPLAVALVNISNPTPQIVSLLSKLTHDSDREVSLNAILALGLVGAGTNNSRVSQLFQTIAKHSYRDSNLMYVLRVSVGLLFMGKGTLTLSPLHSEGFLLNKVSLAGLMVVLFSALDLRSTLCDEFPFLLLFLAMAIRPRWLVTLNTNLEVVNVPVRVGTSVDTIGTAGKQRRISGFQTHKSPVLIGVGERAELATEEMESFSPYLEGIVLVSTTS